jgi:F-type H+-transporting ATPase subunit O
MKKISAAVKKDADLKEFLENPVLSREAKSGAVQKMMAKYSEVTRNFFLLLADNRRLNETVGIVDNYLDLMAAHRGEVTVEVTSAKPLDSKYETQLKNILSKSQALKGSKNLKIVSKVNPSLLGGMIVAVGDKSVDLSISSRMAKLNKALTDSI